MWRVLAGDTDFTPVDLGAYSSRVTFMLGNACIEAARKLKAKVRKAVAAEWGAKPGEVLLAGGLAVRAGDTGTSMPLRVAFNLAEAMFGTLGATGILQHAQGCARKRTVGATIGASPAYSFTAHVAEVEVDVETGFVTVEKIWIAHDCGRALNPVLVAGQMEGSAYMGFAEALMEEQIFKTADQGRAGLHNAPSLLGLQDPDESRYPRARVPDRRVHRPRGALRGRRRPEKGRCIRRFRPSRTPSMTRWACGWTRCRFRRRGCGGRCRRRQGIPGAPF